LWFDWFSKDKKIFRFAKIFLDRKEDPRRRVNYGTFQLKCAISNIN